MEFSFTNYAIMAQNFLAAGKRSEPFQKLGKLSLTNYHQLIFWQRTTGYYSLLLIRLFLRNTLDHHKSTEVLLTVTIKVNNSYMLIKIPRRSQNYILVLC